MRYPVGERLFWRHAWEAQPMSDLSDYQDRILHERTIPRREAEYADFPSRLLPELREYLEERGGIRRLYVHQAEMFDRALDGENVVITTSTASGFCPSNATLRSSGWLPPTYRVKRLPNRVGLPCSSNASNASSRMGSSSVFLSPG